MLYGIPDEHRSVVMPFYLNFLGTNAPDCGRDQVQALLHASQGMTGESLLMLFAAGWRSQVVAAWLSVRFDHPEVQGAVVEALTVRKSWKSVPPLAVSALLTTGDRALPVLLACQAASRGYPLADFLAAAVAMAGDSQTVDTSTEAGSRTLKRMLRIADLLRGIAVPDDDEPRPRRWSDAESGDFIEDGVSARTPRPPVAELPEDASPAGWVGVRDALNGRALYAVVADAEGVEYAHPDGRENRGLDRRRVARLVDLAVAEPTTARGWLRLACQNLGYSSASDVKPSDTIEHARHSAANWLRRERDVRLDMTRAQDHRSDLADPPAV